MPVPAQLIGADGEPLVTDDLNRLVIVNAESEFELASGRVPGKSVFHRFGSNATVPNASFADIWSYGPSDAVYNWLTTADEIRVAAAGNVNDTAAGTGAQSVIIQYLDENWDYQTQEIPTAGASASGLTKFKGIRFIRASVGNAGTYATSIAGANTGDMVIETEGGIVVGHILAGIGQTEMSMFSVPIGWEAKLQHIDITVATGTNKDADIRFWQRTSGQKVAAPFSSKRLIGRWYGVPTEAERTYHSFPTFGPMTDLWVEAQGNGAATSISVDYDLSLVKI